MGVLENIKALKLIQSQTIQSYEYILTRFSTAITPLFMDSFNEVSRGLVRDPKQKKRSHFQWREI